jgi:hypothetical protein
MLFRYRRQICRTEKRHSDIGTLPISGIEEKKNISPGTFEPMTLAMDNERYYTKLL